MERCYVVYCGCRKPLPGSEHVSPVSSAANYPPDMDADAAAAAAGEVLPAIIADEDTAADELPEPTMAASEMDAEKEFVPTDDTSDVDSVEQPVTDKQGEMSFCLCVPTCIISSS